MLKIAIYNNTLPDDSNLKYYIELYTILKNIYCKIDEYSYLPNFISNINTESSYDLLFICFNGNSNTAASIGNQIRETLNNKFVHIVYVSVSSSSENIIELFKSKPMGFLQTPILEEKMFKILNLFEYLKINNKVHFRIRNNNKVYFVPYKDVLYITSNLRKLTIVSNTENYSCYGKISDLEPVSGYISVHKSFLVNVNYIKEYKYDRIKLSNGDIIPISQSLRPTVNKFIKNYKILQHLK